MSCIPFSVRFNSSIFESRLMSSKRIRSNFLVTPSVRFSASIILSPPFDLPDTHEWPILKAQFPMPKATFFKCHWCISKPREKFKVKHHVRQASPFYLSLPFSVSQIKRSMLAFCFCPELINLCSSSLFSISMQGKKLPVLLRFFPESSSETIDDCIHLRLIFIISFPPLKPFPLPSLVFHATTLASGILSPFKWASVCLFVFSYGVILRRIIISYPTITDHISYNHITFIQIVIELSRINK